MKARNITKTAWYQEQVREKMRDMESNAPIVAKSFFEHADRTQNATPESQAQAIKDAVRLQGEWGLSVRDAAELAGRDTDSVKGSTVYHRHFQIARAILDKLPAPEGKNWDEALTDTSLRGMVKHIQDHKAGLEPETTPDPKAEATRLAKLLIARIATHSYVYNVSDVILEYLTSGSDTQALGLLALVVAPTSDPVDPPTSGPVDPRTSGSTVAINGMDITELAKDEELDAQEANV